MVFCVEKKDPHDRDEPSLVFPRRLAVRAVTAPVVLI